MNFFTKIRVTSWIIGLLVLLNMLTLGTLWFQQFRRPPNKPLPQDNRSETILWFLQRELDLTEQQAQQFQTLRQQYLLTSRTIMSEIHQLREELTDELFAASPDAQKADKLAEEIGAKHAALELLLFRHFLELKAVCQPAQQTKFQSLIRDLLEMMKPPDQPRSPGAARPGEPPPGGPPLKSGETGEQTIDRPAGLSPRQPPREAVEACNSKHAGDACEFVTLHGDTKTGNCQTIQNLMACVPSGSPPPEDRRPGDPPPEN